MRPTEEMLKLITDIAKEDDRIRAVMLSGSRANKDCPTDCYQDFDIVYYVKDVNPFWDNMNWIEEKFGKPSLIQKPENMGLIPPDNDGKYVYLMIFPDGNRIDLCITKDGYTDHGEPAVVLLDKDHMLPEIKIDPKYWYVKKPLESRFHDCANEFHWCMNNVAKGIARDEIPYAMEMLNHYVRDMLIQMISWYIGAENDFKVSVGKNGKYFKKYLSPELYQRYINTYTAAGFDKMWNTVFEMLDLFGDVARKTADMLGFSYDEEEEKGIIEYCKLVKNQLFCSREFFEIEYTPDTKDLSEKVADTLELSLAGIMKFFELDRIEKKIEVKITSDLNSYIDHIFQISNNYYEWMVADAYEGKITILSFDVMRKKQGRENMDYEQYCQIIVHELVHICQQQVNADARDCMWFWEGLATNFAGQERFINVADITKEQLVQGFNQLPDPYAVAYTIVHFMLKEYGHEQILNYVKEPKILLDDLDMILGGVQKA